MSYFGLSAMRGSFLNNDIFRTVCLLLLASLMGASSALSAGSGINFRIQDYKPDKFKDRQLAISGNIGAGASQESYELFGTWLGYYPTSFELARFSNSKNNIQVNSRLIRREMNLSKYFSQRLEMSLMYSEYDSRNNESCDSCRQQDLIPDYASRQSEGEGNSVYLQFFAENDMRDYVLDKLAIRVNFVGRAYASFSGSEARKHDDLIVSMPNDYYEIISTDFQGKYRNEHFQCVLSLTIGPSYGRQHEGRYAACALFLLEELKKRGRIDVMPSHNVIRALADTLYRYRNELDWNSRDLRIQSTLAIAQTLSAFGIWNNNDARAILETDDIWQNYSPASRLFGSLASVSLTVEGKYNSRWSRQSEIKYIHSRQFHRDTALPISQSNYSVIGQHNESSSSSSMNYRLSASYSLEEPLALRWQLGLRADVSTLLHR